MPTFCQQLGRTNGFVARGNTDEEVIDAIRKHMGTDHPTLLKTVEREDLFGMIQVE